MRGAKRVRCGGQRQAALHHPKQHSHLSSTVAAPAVLPHISSERQAPARHSWPPTNCAATSKGAFLPIEINHCLNNGSDYFTETF